MGDPKQIEQQVGSGDLVGSVIDANIFIDLNPNVSDGNVLRATVDGARLHGTRVLNGYAGALNLGGFEAIRN